MTTPVQFRLQCLRLKGCANASVAKKFNSLGFLQYIKQIKCVQDLHNILCAYYDGCEVFELEGGEQSCLDSTILKVASRREGVMFL